MRRNKLALYIHLVWATWDRQPLIAAELERRLHRNWQGSYGAFTVSSTDLDRLGDHIQRQKEHHRASQLVGEWEQTFEEIEVAS